MLDADGSTDPAEIPQFVRALTDGADFAKGSPFSEGGGSEDITRIRHMGNDGLNLAVNLLFDTNYTDLCYGYNAFWSWRRAATSICPTCTFAPRPDEMLWGDGFEIETLINCRVGRTRTARWPRSPASKPHVARREQPQRGQRRHPRFPYDPAGVASEARSHRGACELCPPPGVCRGQDDGRRVRGELDEICAAGCVHCAARADPGRPGRRRPQFAGNITIS